MLVFENGYILLRYHIPCLYESHCNVEIDETLYKKMIINMLIYAEFIISHGGD